MFGRIVADVTVGRDGVRGVSASFGSLFHLRKRGDKACVLLAFAATLFFSFFLWPTVAFVDDDALPVMADWYTDDPGDRKRKDAGVELLSVAGKVVPFPLDVFGDNLIRSFRLDSE